MAKQGAPHQTMVEAFARRLRQLYPEPPAIYSEGKVVKPVGLKPDIYLRHSDGRQWAFEMVHGNRQAQHLLDNHRRYAEAGINDIWILWDELRPKAGPARSMDQGVISTALDTTTIYPLNGTHRAILEMQSGDDRYLYAFTVDASAVASAFMQTVAVGLYIYRLQGWNGESHFSAERTFVSVIELQLQDDGRPALPDDATEDEQFGELTRLLGLDVRAGFIPGEMLERVEQFVQSPIELLGPLLPMLVEQALSRLSPEEQRDLVDRWQSAVVQERLAEMPRVQFSNEDAARAFQDPAMMKIMAEKTQLAMQTLKDWGLSQPVLAVFEQLLPADEFAQVAELMQWQADSDALRQARENL